MLVAVELLRRHCGLSLEIPEWRADGFFSAVGLSYKKIKIANVPYKSLCSFRHYYYYF